MGSLALLFDGMTARAPSSAMIRRMARELYLLRLHGGLSQTAIVSNARVLYLRDPCPATHSDQPSAPATVKLHLSLANALAKQVLPRLVCTPHLSDL